MTELEAKREELFPTVQQAIDRFYQWLDMTNVEICNSLTKVNEHDSEKVAILVDTGHLVSDEILDLFKETLMNNPWYSFSFLDKERKAIMEVERIDLALA